MPRVRRVNRENRQRRRLVRDLMRIRRDAEERRPGLTLAAHRAAQVYKVLRRVDKEDKFRLCVKQLAIDWRVPLTRLTDEQLRPYRRAYNRAVSLESSATETINEEVCESLDECGTVGGSKEGITQDYQLGNKSLEIETSQGNSLQDNLLNDESSQSISDEEKFLQGNKDNSDLNNLKVSTGNPQSFLNNNLEDTNLQGFSNGNNVFRNSLVLDECGAIGGSKEGISQDYQLGNKSLEIETSQGNSLQDNLLNDETAQSISDEEKSLQSNNDNSDLMKLKVNTGNPQSSLNNNLEDTDLQAFSNDNNVLTNFLVLDECVNDDGSKEDISQDYQLGNKSLEIETSKGNSLQDNLLNDETAQSISDEEKSLQSNKDNSDLIKLKVNTGNPQSSLNNNLEDTDLQAFSNDNNVLTNFLVLDECVNDDGSKEDISQDYQLGNKSLEIETSKGNSLQDNLLNDETAQSISDEEKSLQSNKDNSDLIKLKVNTGNPQSSLNNNLEDKNLQGFSNDNVLRKSLVLDDCGAIGGSKEGISQDYQHGNKSLEIETSQGNSLQDNLSNDETAQSISDEEKSLQSNKDNSDLIKLKVNTGNPQSSLNNNLEDTDLQGFSNDNNVLTNFLVLDECVNDDGSKEGISHDHQFGNKSLEIETSKGNSLQDNHLNRETSQIVLGEEPLQDNKYNNDLIDLKLNTENPQSSLNNNLEDTNLQEFSNDKNVLSNYLDYADISNFRFENDLSHNRRLDGNFTSENLLGVETPSFSSLDVILEENNLSKDDPFNANNSKVNSVVDESRDEIIKRSSLSNKLQKESAIPIKWDNDSLYKSENNDIGGSLCGNKKKSLVSDTLKNIDCQEEYIEKEIRPQDETCFSDDSDFESAERGLREALEFSENDVIPIERKYITSNTKTAFVLINKESEGLYQRPLPKEIDEKIELIGGESGCIKFKKDAIFTNIEYSNSINSSANQENNYSLYNIKSHALPVNRECENPIEDKEYGTNICLQFSTISNDSKKANQVKVGNMDKAEMISSQIVKSVSPEDFNLVSASNICCKQPISNGKVNTVEQIANSSQDSLHEKNTVNGKGVESVETVEKDIIKSELTFCSYKQSFNYNNTKTEMSQEEMKYSKPKKRTNLASKTEKYKINALQACITKEAQDPLYKSSLGKDKGNEINIFDTKKETKHSSYEKHVMENWWIKYQFTFKNDKMCSSLYYPRGILEYDNESWPDISNELNGKSDEPIKVHINSLLSELEDLEREKNMISTLHESTQGSELEAAEDISDDENLPSAPEKQVKTNVLASKLGHSTETNPDVTILNFMIQQKNINVSNPTKGGTPLQDNVLPIQPPLPSYPPPRTPSPPPLPSLSLETLPPASPPCSPSSLLVPYNELSQEKLSNFLSNIPLPASAPALSTLEKQQLIPQDFKTSEPQKTLELSSSSLTTPTLNKRPDLQSSLPASVSESKVLDLPMKQKMSTLISQKSKLALPLFDSESQEVAGEVLPLQETLKLKHSSSLCNKGSSKSGIFMDFPLPRQVLSVPNSSSLNSVIPSSSFLKLVKPPLLSATASSSDQYFQGLTEGNTIDSVVPQKTSETNVNKQEINSNFCNKNTFILCRNTLRKKNLYVIKRWKLKVKCASIKNHSKKARTDKPHKSKNGKIKKKKSKVSQNRNLLSRIKKNLVLPKQKLKILKNNGLKEQSCNETDNSISTHLPVGKGNDASNESNYALVIKREFTSAINNFFSLSNLSLANEKSYSNKLIPDTVVTIEKEETSFECSNEDCFSTDEISLDMHLENSEDMSKSPGTEGNENEGMVPTIVSVLSGIKPPQTTEVSEVGEFENEDNKFRKFVDETIPGDPIACKYVEDEENIEISFEPIVHNTSNLNLKEESTMLSTVLPVPEKSSLMELDYKMFDQNYLISDLQVSSSDDESEEECYTRPRIINGFGAPFIIPRSQEKNCLVPTKDNATSLNLIKMEGSPNNFQDHQLSNTLPDECTFTKNEDGMVVSSKPLSNNLQKTNKYPKINVPVTSDTKSITNKPRSTLEIPTNEIKDNSTLINRKQIKYKQAHVNEIKKPLKPKNQVETPTNSTEKKVEKSSTYKNNEICDNVEKIRETNAQKPKISKSTKKVKAIDSKKKSHDSLGHAKKSHPDIFKKMHDKIISPKHKNTLKTDSYVSLHTDDNPVAMKVSVDTNFKSRHKIKRNRLPSNETTQKEKISYQPSSIRKRLTSEVENIIPIKKDPTKKCQMPLKNIATPLKRTYSLPEEPSVKSFNSVVDSIVKDMDASPPPKSLVIKEPETQKYVAQAYWCNHISTPVGHSSTNTRDTTESTSRKNYLNNQTHSLSSNCHSVNKHLAEGNLESKNTLRRSISLNSDVVDKKEKFRNLPFKPKKSISFLKEVIIKTPYQSKRSSEKHRNVHSIKYSMQKGEKIKSHEILKSPQSICSSNNVVENRKTRESLPSMPLIEFERRLDSSAKKLGDIGCKTFTSNGMSTAIGTSKNVQSFVASYVEETKKPIIKVSIPICHFISLYGELAGDLPPSNKKKTEKHADENVSKNHSRNSNKMDNKISIYNVKTKSKDLKNSLAKEMLHSHRNIHLNQAKQRNEVTKERPVPMKSEQNSQDNVINSRPARSYEINVDDSNLLVVSGQKLQSKTILDKSVQRSSNCLKRTSTELQSERPAKQKKSSFDCLEPHYVDFNRDVKISSAIASCLDKENDFTTAKTGFSGKSPANDDLAVLTKCNVRDGNITNSERCEQLEISIAQSPLDDVSLKILKDHANTDDPQISMPQANLSDLNVIPCETSKFDGGEINKNGSLILRVKHPSSLQSVTNVETELQQLPRRRISVISPEALSSGVQPIDQEKFKRYTWYMEPENVSTNVSSFPSQDPKDNNCNTTSLFCNLLEEPNKKTELINMFRMSIKIGKKEYERMHDVIRCIELDHKQKQDVIESVKKLQSRDVVKQEIKRATDEYENKLAERGSFFRKTFSNLLDHFKGATDYLYLAFYVFLSQKVVYLCSETALQDSLLCLLKSWVRNDHNKHVFDQNDNAFNYDCEIILGLLRQIEDFSQILSGVNTSMLNQSPSNGREDQLVDFSLKENSSQENDTNALTTTNTNKSNVEPNEIDFSLGNSLINDLSEPHQFTSDSLQTPTQSRPSFEIVDKNTNLQSAECLQSLSECSVTIEPMITKSANVTDVFGNSIHTQNQISSSNLNRTSENRDLQKLPDLEVAMLSEGRTAAMTTNKKRSTGTDTFENETIIRSQELIQQETFSQSGVPKNTSHCVLNTNLQPQFLAQPVCQNSNSSFNENTDRHKQTQGSASLWNNTNRNIALMHNNYHPQMALRDNTNSNIHIRRHQIQHETPVTKYSLSNPLVSQTYNTIDKYKSMRRGKEQSNTTNDTANLLYRGHNVIPSTGSDVAKQTFVRNVSSLPSLSCAQNIGPYNCGLQSEISQSMIAPLMYPVYPRSQNVQDIRMQHHQSNIFNQNTEIEEIAQTCQTQCSYQDCQLTSHRAGQILQPVSNYYPVQQSQHQVAQYTWEGNTTQQMGRENHNLAQGKIKNNVIPNEVSNPQPVQYLSNNSPNFSQSSTLKIHHPITPQQIHVLSNTQRQLSQEISWQQKSQSRIENQFTSNTDTSHFGNIIQDFTTRSTEQNIKCHDFNPQPQMRLSDFKVKNRMGAHPLNHPPSLSDTSHASSQILQNNGQNVTIQHVPPRRLSNDEISTQSIKQPLNQSFHGIDTSKRQYRYQQITSGNQPPGNRRSSIETTQPSQQTSAQFIPPYSSSNQLLAAPVFSVGNIHQSIMNHSQREEILCNIPVDPTMVQMSSGHVQSRRKSSELSEQIDCNTITEADLNKLFNLLDSEKILELMKSVEIKDNYAGQQNVYRNISNLNNASTNIQTSLRYDGTKQAALFNIDKNLQIIAKMPDGDLSFNGVNITKEQLLKFVNICREQVYFAGLGEDQETTFIGQYTTADGRSFTQEESINLMKGAIAMNAEKITKIKITKELEKNRSKVLLIQALKHTAFKDVASYLRIINILKGLAKDNDKDAQQAVQEIAGILRIVRQPEQIVSNNPVIVIDD